jgi:hypothetical protein
MRCKDELRGENMDRLISEKQVLDTIADFIKNNDSVAKLILNINAIPSAEPYKGMTNGEVIKMLYPQGEIVKGLYGISGNPLICVNLNISTECSEMVFTEDWWNSPYEPQESEGKK